MTHASLLLAAFISPALFFGGAAAVAAPILIHLLARRRFKRIRWAAMDFLIHAERRNKRRLRMEEWILLALRCLAVLFIAAMVARPFLKPVGASALWGGSQRTERIFVIDDSLSMAYETPEGTPFEQAKTAVRRLIDSIRGQTPGDSVTILRMSAPRSPVESGTYLNETQTAELFARLDALTPSQRSIDPGNVVESVAELLERNPDITNAAVYILSDFQRHNWVKRDSSARDGERGAESSRLEASRRLQRASVGAGSAGNTEAASDHGASILRPLSAWAKGDRGLRLVFINLGVDDAANLAVTELSIHGGRLVAGVSSTVRSKIANYSNQSKENLEVRITVGNLPQPSKTLRELAPQQSVSVDVEGEFLRAGFEAVRVEVSPPAGVPLDALPADNVRFFAAEVAGAIRVLVVNGEPSADGFNDEVMFLATALRPEGDVFSGNEITVVDEAEFEDVNLTGYHVVVFANVYRVSDLGVESLERFVRRGGGLLLFLGDQVDADLYNTALYRNGEGLLPAELTEVIRAADASHLVITDRLHPALRNLSGEGDPLGIGQIAFFEYFGCVPFDAAGDEMIEENNGNEPRALTRADAGSPVAPRGLKPAARQARVIARFDDADEHPAVVERPFGRGTVMLVTTTVDKEWHHWPDHPTFLPVMMELVHHVARRSGTDTKHWVGEPIELPLDPAVFEPDVLVRTPAYPNEHEVSLTATSLRRTTPLRGATEAGDGRGLFLTWEHTDTAGLYQFLLRRREGGETVRLVAVNVDPRESDLTIAQEDELRRAMGDVAFEYIKGLDLLSGAAGETRTELWRLLLFATALVLMTEQSLAWWWGRRR